MIAQESNTGGGEADLSVTVGDSFPLVDTNFPGTYAGRSAIMTISGPVHPGEELLLAAASPDDVRVRSVMKLAHLVTTANRTHLLATSQVPEAQIDGVFTTAATRLANILLLLEQGGDVSQYFQ